MITTNIITNEVEVIKTSRTEYAVYLEAKCGKTTALVVIGDYGIRVIVQNAMHRAYRGMGKNFQSLSEALTNYKTAEIKAIIIAADSLNA